MQEVCDWCRKLTEVKNKIESDYHHHHHAHKIQKVIKLVGHFEFVDQKKKPVLCLDCQKKVISGMNTGGNWS